MILVSKIIQKSKQSNMALGTDSKSSKAKKEIRQESLTSSSISNRNTNGDLYSSSTEQNLSSFESLGENSWNFA